MPRWLLILFLAIAHCHAFSFPKAPEFRITQWTTEKGLPHNKVQALAQTPDGYLWVGTLHGIARFNGLTFEVFNETNGSGLTNENCVALSVSPSGELYAAMQRGIARFDRGRFVHLSLPQMRDRANYLKHSSDGVLWAGTPEGLFEISSNSVHHFSVTNGLPHNQITALETGPNGIWIGTLEGFNYFNFGSRQFEMIDPKAWVTAIMRDPHGDLWEADHSGLRHHHNNQVTTFSITNGLSTKNVSSLSVTPNGEIVVGCSPYPNVPGTPGLDLIADGKVHPIALPGFALSIVDREGNIWVGTGGDGLLRLQKPQFNAITSKDGLASDEIRSVCEDNSGAIWAATAQGISRIRPDGILNLSEHSDSNESCEVRSIFPRSGGGIWIGRRKHVSYAIDEWTDFIKPSWVQGRRGGEMVWENGGRLFVVVPLDLAPHHAIFQIDPDSGQYDDIKKVWGDARVFHRDRTGALWIGTARDGLWQITTSATNRFTTADGLCDNTVHAILESSSGQLWFGSDNGLNLLRNGKFLRVTIAEGLPENPVNSILEDDQGAIWIGGERGIYRYNRASLENAALTKKKISDVITYGVADGMPTDETNGGRQPCAWKARDGTLYYATPKGLVYFNPATLRKEESHAPINIERLWANGYELPAHSSQTPFLIGPGIDSLQVDFASPTLTAPEKVQFRYKLQGFDHDWINAGTRRAAFYRRLPPRQYEFQVIAANRNGLWSEKPATFAFTVLPWFRETAAFYALLGVTTLLIAFAAYRWRLAYLRNLQKSEREKALEQERLRIAQDMHDQLGANLTKVKLLAEVALQKSQDPEHVTQQINRLLAINREAADVMDEIVWTVNPRNDSLDELASFISHFCGEFFHDTPIRCRYRFPAEFPGISLPSEFRHNLLLILKEALTNVLKHSGATEVWIALLASETHLELLIEDNGHGLPDQPTYGSGIRNMSERAERLGGRLSIAKTPNGTALKLLADLRHKHLEPHGARN